MKSRCYSKDARKQKYYGSKGIIVCEQWLDFMAFYNWAVLSGWREGLSIERKDNNRDYCPDNCTWIRKNEQPINRSICHRVVIDGKEMLLTEAIKYLKSRINKGTIIARLNSGWDHKEAIVTPVMKLRRKHVA